MATIISIPIDIFLSIFFHLSLRDVVKMRQTCWTIYRITKLRSVWHVLLATHIRNKNIPIPRLYNKPIESHSASQLEALTFSALRLRQNWSSLSPLPTREFILNCDVSRTRLGVVSLQFLSRNPQYLLSLALCNDTQRTLNLQCWDLGPVPPECIAMRTIQGFGSFITNSDPYATAALAAYTPDKGIELLSIDFSGVNPMQGFSTLTQIPGRRIMPKAFHGFTLLTKDEEKRIHFWDARSPTIRLELRTHSTEKLEDTAEAILRDQFAIVFRRTSIEIYGICLVPTSNATFVYPKSQHNWHNMKVDSISIACQVTTAPSLPILHVLIRFGSGLPWPVNLLHHFVLHPYREYNVSRPIDDINIPYTVIPQLRQKLGSPVRLFAPYHMAVGTRGTALWIDTHTEDYFGLQNRGQRLAASLRVTSDLEQELLAVTWDEDEDIISTIEASVFGVCEYDGWTRLAVDEEEGRIAIGRADGKIVVREYA